MQHVMRSQELCTREKKKKKTSDKYEYEKTERRRNFIKKKKKKTKSTLKHIVQKFYVNSDGWEKTYFEKYIGAGFVAQLSPLTIMAGQFQYTVTTAHSAWST